MPVASELMVHVGFDGAEAESGLARIGGLVGGFAGLATAGFIAVGAAAAGMFAGAVEQGSAFQQLTQNVQNNTTMTTAQLDVMRQGILALSSDSGTSLDTLGQGFMKVMNLSGNAAASMAILSVANESAVSTGGNAASTANVLANAMHEYGLDVVKAADGTLNLAAVQANAAQTMGIMHLAAAEGNMTLEQFSDSSGKAIGIAANLGIPLSDVSAAFAALTKHGFDAAQAGTQVTDLMTHMINPSKAAAAEIERVSKLTGVDLVGDFSAAGVSSKGLTGVLGDLKDAYMKMGLTEAEAEQESMKLISAQRGGLGLASLLGTGYADYTSILGDLNNQTLTNTITEDAYTRTRETAAFQWDALKRTVQAAAIVFGTTFLPAVAQVEQAATAGIKAVLPFVAAFGPTLLSTFGNAATAIRNAASAVLGAFQALLSGQITFAQFLGGMQIFVGTILGHLGNLAAQAGPYIGRFFSSILSFLQGALPQIAAQMTTWAGALVGWLATAIPQLLTNLGLWAKTFTTWLTGTWFPLLVSFYGPLAQAFGGWLTATAIPFLRTNLPLWLAALSTWVTGTALPAIGAAVGQIGAAFGSWIQGTAIPYVRQNLPGWLAAISSWITGTAVPAVTTALVALGTAFGDWVATKAVPWVQANLPGWMAAITTWITGTGVPAVTAALEGMGKALGDWVATKAVPAVEAAMPVWGAAIVHWVDTAKDSVQAGLETLANAMGDWVKDKATPKVEADLPGWIAAITAAVDKANAGVSTGTDTLAQTLGNWVDTKALPLLGDGLSHYDAKLAAELAVWPVTVAVGTVALSKAITDWAGDPANKQLVTNLDALMNTISTWILTSAFLIPILAAKIGTAIGQGIGDGINQKWPEVAAWLSGLPQRVVDAVGDMAGALYQKGVDAIQGLINGILSQAGAVGSAIGNITSLIPGGISQLLGIKSPSRVLMGLGDYAIQGLVLGMQGRAGDVQATSRDIGTGLIGGLTTAITAGNAAVQKTIADTVSAVSKAINDALGALAALSSFDFAKNSPSGATLGWFSALTAALVATIVDAASAFKADALKAASDFSDTAGKVAGFIKAALDAFQALAAYDFTKGSPTGSALGWFGLLVQSLVATIAQAATGFDAVALKAASDFADAASKVTGLVKGALDAFAGLATYTPPAVANLYAFGKTLLALVNDFAVMAERITADMYTEAAKFADSAGKVVAIIGGGVDAFTKLGDYTAPPVAALYAFGKTLLALVNDFAVMAERITVDMYTEAAAFAEGAGKVVGMIGSGVDAFAKLGDYTAPATAAIYAFGKTLRAVVNDFSLLAEQITQDATDQAAKFATGAGTVVGIIGNAVDGLSKLATFVAPSQAAIDNFVYAVYETVRKIGEMADQMSKEGVAQAGALGTAAGSVFNAAKTALDVFHGFKDLVIPSSTALDNLAIGMQYVVVKLGQIADQIGKDGIKKAQDFGTATGSIFSALKTAMDTLTSLEKFPDLAKKAMDAFLAGIQQVVQRMVQSTDQAGEFAKQASGYKAQILAGVADVRAAQQALNTIGSLGGLPDLHKVGNSIGNSIVDGAKDALDSHSPSQVMAQIGRDVVAGLVQGMTQTQMDAAKAAADLAQNVAKAVTDTIAAMTALSSFNVAKNTPSGAQIGGVLGFIRQAIDGVRGVAGDLTSLTTTAGAALNDAFTKWLDSTSKAVSLFSSGVDALTKLAGYVQVGQGAIDNFGADLRVAVNDLIYLSNEISTDLTAQAADWADNVGKAIAVYGTGADAFDKLRGYAQVGSASIYAFGKDLMLALADMSVMLDKVGLDAATNAGVFGEQVGKATGGIVNAVAALGALKGYIQVPAANIYAFGKDLMLLMADFNEIVNRVGVDMLAGAGSLGDAIGKVLGSVGTAVQGFKDLVGFAGVPESALDAFAASVTAMIRRMAEIAKTVASQGVDAAAALGDGLGKVFAGLNAGTSFFKSLDNILLPDQAGIDRILAPILAVVNEVADAAASFDPARLALAGAFSDTLGKIMAGIQAGNQALAPVAGGGGGGGGGQTIVYEFNMSGANIYGFDSFEDEVVSAIEDARRRGRVP